MVFGKLVRNEFTHFCNWIFNVTKINFVA